MPAFFRRYEIARSLDRSLDVETPPIQLRDAKTNLILTASANIHAVYRVIHTRKFAQHYMDFPSFEADFTNQLRISGSTVLGDVLAGADRSRFVQKSNVLGKEVAGALKPFLEKSGVVLLSCTCIPIVKESRVLDDIEWKGALQGIDPAVLIGEVWGKAGAGFMSGMNPLANAYFGRMICPDPPQDSRKDPLI